MNAVVDPTRAGALEEGEGPVVRVEDHLLALTHVGPREHHPAVAEPCVRDLHGDSHARDQHHLMAPVELVGLARRVIERDIGLGRHSAAAFRPDARIAADGVIAALVAGGAQLLVDPDQSEPLAR